MNLEKNERINNITMSSTINKMLAIVFGAIFAVAAVAGDGLKPADDAKPAGRIYVCKIALIISLIFCWFGANAAEPASAAPAVLIIGSEQPLPIEAHLREQGWQTLVARWTRQTLDARFLCQFNVILLANYPKIDKDAKANNVLVVKPDYEEPVRSALQEFVSGGGGLLTFGGDYPMDRDATNAFLKPWDIEVLREQVVDPAHSFTQKNGMRWVYLFTDNIRQHPITKNVRTIFYPTLSVHGSIANPLKTGSAWQPVVLGSEQAASHPIIKAQQRDIVDETRPGTYSKDPILAAVRNVGKGRVAVFGWGAIPTYYDYGHFMVEDIYFTRGGDGKPSDGLKLLDQTLAWLAEPSMNAKSDANSLGGYKNKPMQKKADIPKPVLWTPKDMQGKDPSEYWRTKLLGDMDPKGRWYRGLIGARTKLTGGTGTVAEYAAAARAAKLDFIAFTERVEDLSAISKETWDKFRKECQEATGPDLLVLPGQLIQRGDAGDWYFRISDFESPPKRDFLTKDGKRIENALYEHFASGRNSLGPLDIRNEPTPYWASRNYNSMAVATIKDGQMQIDLEPFLYVTQNLDDPKPVAIDLITSPDQVAAAAKRFVNLRFSRSQDELRSLIKLPDNGLPVQISSGPVITNWQGSNLWRQTYGINVPGRERLLVRLQAKSDRPLAEAVIYDGPKIYRRYKLDGNSCDLFIHALHDQQRQFVAVVKDVDGGMAVAAQMATADLFNRRTICSDRQNSLTSSMQLDAQGCPLTCAAGIMQEKYGYRQIAGVCHANSVDFVPPMWDGTPGPAFSAKLETSMWEPPYAPRTKDGYQHLIGRMEFPMGSRDVLCQAVGYESVSPDKPPHYQGFWPMQALKGFNGYARIIEFKKTPDQPAASLIEGYYVMLEDGKWEKHDGKWSNLSHQFYSMTGQDPGEMSWFFMNPAKGENLSGTGPDKSANFCKLLEPGGYVAYAQGTDQIACFPVDTPMQVMQQLNQNMHRTFIGYNRIGESYRKGDIVPFRFVAYVGLTFSTPDNKAIEKFRSDYGLNGAAPIYTVTSRAGKVLGTRYVLELEARDGGFGGMISKAKLDTRLPIRVHGVNPNWTCGLVEKSEKWWLPIGVMDDLKLTPEQQSAPTRYSAYAALELSKDRDVWIGNVVLCDQPDLKLTLLPEGDGRFSIEAHNPTDKDIVANVRTAAEFSLIPPFSRQVTVKAGASKLLELIQ